MMASSMASVASRGLDVGDASRSQGRLAGIVRRCWDEDVDQRAEILAVERMVFVRVQLLDVAHIAGESRARARQRRERRGGEAA